MMQLAMKIHWAAAVMRVIKQLILVKNIKLSNNNYLESDHSPNTFQLLNILPIKRIGNNIIFAYCRILGLRMPVQCKNMNIYIKLLSQMSSMFDTHQFAWTPLACCHVIRTRFYYNCFTTSIFCSKCGVAIHNLPLEKWVLIPLKAKNWTSLLSLRWLKVWFNWRYATVNHYHVSYFSAGGWSEG